MRRRNGGLPAAKAGFTLVELVIAMTVFSFALIIALTGFITIVKIYRNSLAQRDSQVYARTILDTIVRDAREAKSVTVAYPYKANPDSAIQDFCLDFGGSGERYFTTVTPGSPQQYSFGKVQHDPQSPCLVDASGQMAGDTTSARQYINSPGNTQVTLVQVNPINANTSQGTVVVGMSVQVRVAYKSGASFLDPASLNCTPGVGSEFCATTTLSSVVTFRGGNL